MKGGRVAIAAAVSLILTATGCRGGGDTSQSRTSAPPAAAQAAGAPRVELPEGPPPRNLVAEDLKEGHGARARAGDLLTTQFVAVYITGKPFESTWERGRKPFSFHLGANESSPGWERGLRGMRVGERRELIVPPDLFSRFGTPPGSGPEDTLVYVVDLVAINGSSVRKEPVVHPPTSPPPRKLIVKDLIRGAGPPAKRGDRLTVEYVGIHYDGSPFTNSWERSRPFRFTLGRRTPFVNPGWQKGIEGMRVGGRRELIIPPRLLYEGGAPPGAKPSDALVYVIDLVAIG